MHHSLRFGFHLPRRQLYTQYLKNFFLLDHLVNVFVKFRNNIFKVP